MIRSHVLFLATILAMSMILAPLDAFSQPVYREREERHARDFVEFLKTFGADVGSISFFIFNSRKSQPVLR